MLITAIASAMSLPAGVPDEVQLLPAAGAEIPLIDGRGPFRIKDAAAIVAASLTGRDLPIDFDHSIDRDGGGRAAGWIVSIEARADGIWGKVEWTEAGRAALASREYRFLSPVFLHTPAGEIRRVLRAALTNDPAMPQLKALASRGTSQEDIMDELLKALRAALGLADEATSDQVVAAASRVRAEAEGRRAEIEGLSIALCAKKSATAEEMIAAANAGKGGDQATIDGLQKQIASLQAERATDKATVAVDDAITAGKLTPAQRGWAISYASRQPEEFATFIEKQPVILTPGATVPGKPAGGDRGDLSDVDKEVCAALGLSEAAFLATRKKESN